MNGAPLDQKKDAEASWRRLIATIRNYSLPTVGFPDVNFQPPPDGSSS